MSVIGRVESVWRYPVKSMGGEELQAAFAGFAGIYGDRLYAFKDSAAQPGFPYLTAREQGDMLLCRPSFRHPESMKQPLNLTEAQASAPGATPLYASAAESVVDVGTPEGEKLAIDDPALIRRLTQGIRESHQLSLLRSDRAMTDCRPISLFSIQTVRRLSEELTISLDKRRFRANVYLDLPSFAGFDEEQFVGHTLRIGDKATFAVVERDPRCKLITLDPNTSEPNPEVMKHLANAHDRKAGLYAAVLAEGVIRPGDEVALIK